MTRRDLAMAAAGAVGTVLAIVLLAEVIGRFALPLFPG